MKRMRFLYLVFALIPMVTAAAVTGESFLLANDDRVIGQMNVVQSNHEDTLIDVARRFGLGYEEIVRANPGVDPWLPGEGAEVLLPTRFVLPDAASRGLVINVAEYRMYYFRNAGDAAGMEVMTFPISIGRMDWGTPLGKLSVASKLRQPSWYPPESVRKEHEADGRTLERVVPPGPDNPLGEYAMRLSMPSYLIHGTNRPAGIGMRVTHGCIRMFPEDIAWLFPQIPVDTPVRIVNQPYKLGWLNDDLYLEVHPRLEESAASEEAVDGEETVADESEEEEAEEVVESDAADSESSELTEFMELYIRVTRERSAEVDWERVSEVFRERLGIAVKVGDAVPEAIAEEEVVAVTSQMH
jgi:L,D-transpeptidase ErfK/SrfK